MSGRIVDLLCPVPADFRIDDIAWSLSRQSRFGGHSMCRTPYTVAQHTVMVSRHVEAALKNGSPENELFAKYMTSHFMEATDEIDQDRALRVLDRIKSVQAQHSMDKQKFIFHGLMHDFAEAYLVDLPTPVKRLPGVYDAYKKVEREFDAIIYETFGLPYSATKFPLDWEFGQALVGWADEYALSIEAYHFMPSRGLTWGLNQPRPSIEAIDKFRQPISNRRAYTELIRRFNQLKPINYLG